MRPKNCKVPGDKPRLTFVNTSRPEVCSVAKKPVNATALEEKPPKRRSTDG